MSTLDLASRPLTELAGLWHPEGVYLDSATYGLPPQPAWDALHAALDEWRGGTGRWEEWSEATQRARESFARLVGVPAGRVAVGGSVGELFGLVAAAVPDGTRVLVADDDFTSLLFPLVVQEERGVTLVSVPTSELAERLDSSFGAVAFSAVQSSTGEVADLDAIEAAAAAAGALTLLDATHAVGWLPFDAVALRRGGVRRVQVADVAARHGVPLRRRAVRRARPPAARELVRGRGASTTPTTGCRCGSRTTPAGSTARPPGSPGSGARRRSSWSSRSASSGSTSTTSRSRTPSAPGSGSSRRTRRS